MKLMTVLFVPQMLQHIRLNALPAGSRLQCTLGLLVVLWHQDKQCFSPTGDRPQQAGCQGVGDVLSHLLAVLLDASVGTSVFRCLPPHALLQCLHTMVTQVVPHCLAPDHPCQLCRLHSGHVSCVCFFLAMSAGCALKGCFSCLKQDWQVVLVALVLCLEVQFWQFIYIFVLKQCPCFTITVSAVYVFHWTFQLCMFSTGHVSCVCFTLALLAVYASL